MRLITQFTRRLERYRDHLIALAALLLVALMTGCSAMASPPETKSMQSTHESSAGKAPGLQTRQSAQSRAGDEAQMIWIWISPEERRKMPSDTPEYVVEEIHI